MQFDEGGGNVGDAVAHQSEKFVQGRGGEKAGGEKAGPNRDTAGRWHPAGGASPWAGGGKADPTMRASETGDGADPPLRPGTLYVLRDGKPVAVSVMTGLSDGAFTEVRGDLLKPDDRVVVGLDVSAQGPNLQPPPGMGGPQFGPPGGRRGGGR